MNEHDPASEMLNGILNGAVERMSAENISQSAAVAALMDCVALCAIFNGREPAARAAMARMENRMEAWNQFCEVSPERVN